MSEKRKRKSKKRKKSKKTTRRNPVNWGRYALIHELEGSKPKLRLRTRVKRGRTYLVKTVPNLPIIVQDIKRAEIPKSVCEELKSLGFHPFVSTTGRRVECTIYRANEILCFGKKAIPHYIAEDTKTRMKDLIRDIEGIKPTAPRKPFRCPV